MSSEIVAKTNKVYGFTKRIATLFLLSVLTVSFGLMDALAENRYVKGNKSAREVMTIVLDPGHGGHDSGVTGPDGTKEKDIALSLARALKERLSGRYEVLVTRKDDYWINIEERTAIANNHDADLFISLHVGGGFRRSTNGLGTFYWSGEKTKGAGHAASASQEWNSDQESPVWERIQEEHRTKSRAMAQRLHKELMEFSHLHDRECRAAPLYLLAGADMPAMLIEVGCLTCPADEKQLSKPLFLQIIADRLNEIITGLLEDE